MPVRPINVLIIPDILRDINNHSIFVPKDKFTQHKIYTKYIGLIVSLLD